MAWQTRRPLQECEDNLERVPALELDGPEFEPWLCHLLPV